MGTKLRAFFKEVWLELKKVSWPSRNEIIESTSVVIVTVLLLTVFIGLCDIVLVRAVGVILK